MKIETIHESYVNGNRKQMAEQIQEYCHQNNGEWSDFFADYNDWLDEMCFDYETHLNSFVDVVYLFLRNVNH